MLKGRLVATARSFFTEPAEFDLGRYGGIRSRNGEHRYFGSVGDRIESYEDGRRTVGVQRSGYGRNVDGKLGLVGSGKRHGRVDEGGVTGVDQKDGLRLLRHSVG